MFDAVPTRVWLLITIAVAAFAPARYIFRYITHSPSRTDITRPPEDLGWRTSSHLARSSAILAGLAALAVFIFTPAAEQFARSPSFWPILLVAVGGWVLFSIAKGFAKGCIQPLARGFYDTYEREAQPKRFWASLMWNGFLGAACLWGGVAGMTSATQDQCYDRQTRYSPEEEIAACNRLIAEQDDDTNNFADVIAARGYAYHRLGDYEHALADYSKAIQLDHDDSYSLYNRALIYQDRGDSQHAVADYTRSLQLRPDNAAAYFNRGDIFLNDGKFDDAIADLTKAHALDPENIDTLAERGLAYAWKGDAQRAEKDFAIVRSADPSNWAVLHGEALLSMNAGKFDKAVAQLSVLLERDPRDAWSLRLRIPAYHMLGEDEKAQTDINRLRQLTTDAPIEVVPQ